MAHWLPQRWWDSVPRLTLFIDLKKQTQMCWFILPCFHAIKKKNYQACFLLICFFYSKSIYFAMSHRWVTCFLRLRRSYNGPSWSIWTCKFVQFLECDFLSRMTQRNPLWSKSKNKFGLSERNLFQGHKPPSWDTSLCPLNRLQFLVGFSAIFFMILFKECLRYQEISNFL